ncbi:uncharacterized protein SCHCODRAFT_02640549 [Schizophyllum commune H4-8]|uniref:uncharacterized protein n=1 Tax=Schizophyllum commune (strain H4-8 / FGSC 9210) TaxID=578458 RepID=UPI00215FE1AA|nr:uncharacterized protein SCHCODRAFT_02640549 [Schizophyllum commune H4-8]KAI5887033.1 hypothetical protein SCHCODRAFT_02640549 [Schizophyllum commune H4-8]
MDRLGALCCPLTALCPLRIHDQQSCVSGEGEGHHARHIIQDVANVAVCSPPAGQTYARPKYCPDTGEENGWEIENARLLARVQITILV